MLSKLGEKTNVFAHEHIGEWSFDQHMPNTLVNSVPRLHIPVNSRS